MISDRLHQEAILLAAKADIREELDRLSSHIAQAKKLLVNGGAIGRKLDFLAQELHRESKTLTAKANDVELTKSALSSKAWSSSSANRCRIWSDFTMAASAETGA